MWEPVQNVVFLCRRFIDRMLYVHVEVGRVFRAIAMVSQHWGVMHRICRYTSELGEIHTYTHAHTEYWDISVLVILRCTNTVLQTQFGAGSVPIQCWGVVVGGECRGRCRFHRGCC